MDAPTAGRTAAPDDRIRVAILYVPEDVPEVESHRAIRAKWTNGVLCCLAKSPLFHARVIPLDDLLDDQEVTRYQVIVVGSGAFKPLKRYCDVDHRRRRQRLRQFVESGGGYLGICAGAFFACTSDEVNDGGLEIIALEARKKDGRERSVTLSYTQAGERLFHGVMKDAKFSLEGGPALSAYTGAKLTNTTCTTLATFTDPVTEIAIACAKFGNGRVLVCSPHCEFPGYSETVFNPQFIQRAVEYLAGRRDPQGE